MWSIITERLLNWGELLCALAAFAVPYSTYKINLMLHEFGDPPWKREDQQTEGKDTSEGS